jgi:hypothetical protein
MQAVKPPNISSLVELARMVLYVGMPAPRYTLEEVEAAKAEYDRQQTVLGDAAIKLAPMVRDLQDLLDISAACGFPNSVLTARFEEQKRKLERLWQLRLVLGVQQGFLADYLVLLSPNFHSAEQREAAAERIADQLKRFGPFKKVARAALREVARKLGRDQKALLRKTMVRAVYLVAEDAEGFDDRRQAQVWIKDREGNRVEFRPSRQYGPASPEFRFWFGSRVRERVEKDLIELAGWQDGEDPESTHESLADHEAYLAAEPADEGDLDPDLSWLEDELTAEDRALLERCAQKGRRSPRDQKRLERLRLRLRPGIRKIS